MSDRITAIVLAAGRGRRMGSRIQKQYMQLAGQPLICHALRAFEQSPVDDIILVCGPGEEEYCRREIVDAYGFAKVRAVIPGGAERYDSVYAGLKAASGCDYVLIHDGARPCVTDEIIRAAIDGARQYEACEVAVPVKDTIKVADADEFAVETPPRSSLWAMQTPQAFSYPLVYEAYRRFLEPDTDRDGGAHFSGNVPSPGNAPFSGNVPSSGDAASSGSASGAAVPPAATGSAAGSGAAAGNAAGQLSAITDDAMVVERFMGRRARLRISRSRRRRIWRWRRYSCEDHRYRRTADKNRLTMP